MERKPYPSDLTDEQWEIIAPLMPPARPRGRGREVDLRQVMNTLLYMSRTGCQWAFLPHDLLPKSTVWDYFDAWKKDGTWQRLLDALRRRVRTEAVPPRQEDPSAACIDTQSVPTHHQGNQSTVDGGKKVKGRKRHIVVDTMGLLLAAAVTGAALHDGRSAPEVLGELDEQTKRRLEVIFADTKYRTEPLDQWILERGEKYRMEVVSRPSSNEFKVIRKRWVVERTYAWMGWNRWLSKDYERTTTSGEAWMKVAMIHLMLNRLKPIKQNKSSPEFKYRSVS